MTMDGVGVGHCGHMLMWSQVMSDHDWDLCSSGQCQVRDQCQVWGHNNTVSTRSYMDTFIVVVSYPNTCQEITIVIAGFTAPS